MKVGEGRRGEACLHLYLEREGKMEKRDNRNPKLNAIHTSSSSPTCNTTVPGQIPLPQKSAYHSISSSHTTPRWRSGADFWREHKGGTVVAAVKVDEKGGGFGGLVFLDEVAGVGEDLELVFSCFLLLSKWGVLSKEHRNSNKFPKIVIIKEKSETHNYGVNIGLRGRMQGGKGSD